MNKKSALAALEIIQGEILKLDGQLCTPDVLNDYFSAIGAAVITISDILVHTVKEIEYGRKK